jgi:hypothetical protein
MPVPHQFKQICRDTRTRTYRHCSLPHGHHALRLDQRLDTVQHATVPTSTTHIRSSSSGRSAAAVAVAVGVAAVAPAAAVAAATATSGCELLPGSQGCPVSASTVYLPCRHRNNHAKTVLTIVITSKQTTQTHCPGRAFCIRDLMTSAGQLSTVAATELQMLAANCARAGGGAEGMFVWRVQG